MTERRPHMQEGQHRVTLTRGNGDKWVVHIDGTRKPGIETAQVLALVHDLLDDPDGLASIMVETKPRSA